MHRRETNATEGYWGAYPGRNAALPRNLSLRPAVRDLWPAPAITFTGIQTDRGRERELFAVVVNAESSTESPSLAFTSSVRPHCRSDATLSSSGAWALSIASRISGSSTRNASKVSPMWLFTKENGLCAL